MAGRDLDLKKVDDTTLDDDDLAEITEAMQDVASNFPLIGTALHLKHGDVSLIKKECFGDYRSGLERVVVLWLHQQYNVSRFGDPTWRTVVQVVDKSAGGNNHALAKKIAAAHQVGVPGAPKKPIKSRAGQVNVSTIQESGQPTEDVSVPEVPPSEPTRNDQANTNFGHDYLNQYNNQDPGMTHYHPQETSQPRTPVLNRNPHHPLREAYSEPAPGDHRHVTQRFSSEPEGQGHKHPRSETHPQGHHQIQPGVYPRFQPGDQPSIRPGGQPGSQLSQFSQPAQGSVVINTPHVALYHSQDNLYPTQRVAHNPKHMGKASMGGYSVPPTAYLQQPGTSQQPMQSGTNTQQPTQGASYPQQPMQSGTNTQQPTQGASYPQQPMQSWTNTQQPTQGASYPQQPMQSWTNTQQPTQGASYPQQPMQSGTNTQQPTQGASYPQQPMQSGTNTQQPTQGASYPQQPMQSGMNTQQPTQGASYPQQPMQSGTNTQQPTQGASYPQQHMQSGTNTQQPTQGASYPQQPMQSGTNTQQPTQGASYPQQPMQSGTNTQQPMQSGTNTQQPMRSGTNTQQPTQGTGHSQQPMQSGTNTQQPAHGASYSQQPMQSGTNTQQPTQGASYPQQTVVNTRQSQQPTQGSERDEPDFKPVHVGLNVSPPDLPGDNNSTDSPSASPHPPLCQPVVSPAPSSSHLSSTPPQASRPSSAPPQTDPASGTPPPLGMGTSQSATGLPQQMAAMKITDQPQQPHDVTHGQGAQNSSHIVKEGTPQNLSGHKSPSASGGASSRVTEEVPADRDTNLQQIPGGHIGSSHGGQANLVTQQSQTQAVGHHSLTFCVAKTPVGTLPHSASGGQLDTPAQSLTNSTLPSFLSDVEIVARGGNHSGGAHPQGMTTSGGAHSPAVEQVSQSHPHHIDHTNFVLCPSGSPHQNVGTIGASGSHDLHSASGGQLDTPAQSLTNSTLPSFPSDVEIVASGGNMSESTLGSYSLDQQPLGMSNTANHTVPPPDQTQVANPAYPSLANSTLPSFRSVPEVDRVAKTKDDQTDEKVREKPPTLSMSEPSNVAGSSQHSQETPQGNPGKLALDSRPKALQFHKTDCYTKCRVSADGGNISFQTYTPYGRENLQNFQAVGLSFGVVHPEKIERQPNPLAKEYEMKIFPHGLAIIINNETFRDKRHRWREGTKVDERNLVTTFRYLGYNVEVHRNRDVDQMCEIFEEIKTRDHSSCDSFVCCILTHGERDKVVGTDSKSVMIETLTQRLCGNSCPQLNDKPKLFFIQACRGKLRSGTAVAPDNGGEDEESCSGEDEQPEHIVTDSDHPIRTSLQRLPSFEEMSRVEADSEIPDVSDFYFGYATPLGHVSWRDLDHGSWFISELCKGLCKYSRCSSLLDIMTMVNNEVSTNVQYKVDGHKQAPEIVSRLRKKVFF